jgi:hypothetical protein
VAESPSAEEPSRDQRFGVLLLQLRFQLCGSLKFLLRLRHLALPSQRLSQLGMSRRIVRSQIDRSPKLRDRTFKISHSQQPFPRVRIKVAAWRLVLSLLICRTQQALTRGSISVAQLPQDGRKRGMSSGEVGLQTDCLPQRCGGFLQLALLLQHGAKSVVPRRKRVGSGWSRRVRLRPYRTRLAATMCVVNICLMCPVGACVCAEGPPVRALGFHFRAWDRLRLF